MIRSCLYYNCIFGLICLALLFNNGYSAEFSKETAQNAVTASRQTAIVTAVAKASPTVVNISAVRNVQTQPTFDDLFWGEIPFSRRRSFQTVGSGVIIDKKGHILTNHHVIEGADDITVIASDGQEFTAEILGYDYFSDLALLRVDADTNLPEIHWGDSESLLIGEWAVAIGNPFGLSIGNAQPTVTAGIVSATKRSLIVNNLYHENLIQTDASINRGNSGGALVNIQGELIGINTFIRSTSGGSQGVGFAIPVNKAKKVLQQLSEYGNVIPPYLAVEVQTITEALAEKLAIPLNAGILVSEIEKQSPIAKAGVKRGDVIVRISGHQIRGKEDFHALTRLLPLNQPISCEFSRRGKKRQTKFTLKTRQWNHTPPGWGITFAQPDKAMAHKYQRPGIVITHVDKQSGLTNALKRGDLIYQIDDTKIHSLEVFKIVDENIRSQYRTLLHFERDGVHETIRVTFNRNNRRR